VTTQLKIRKTFSNIRASAHLIFGSLVVGVLLEGFIEGGGQRPEEDNNSNEEDKGDQLQECDRPG